MATTIDGQNIDAIQVTAGQIGSTTLTAANTSKVGAGAATIFTAGANGSRLDRIAFRSKGACVATVARIFISDGTTTSLIDEIDLPITLATELSSKPSEEYARPILLPAGHSILVAIATAVTDGWVFTAFGGDY